MLKNSETEVLIRTSHSFKLSMPPDRKISLLSISNDLILSLLYLQIKFESFHILILSFAVIKYSELDANELKHVLWALIVKFF